MAVPNTTTFTLQNVVDSLPLTIPAVDDLVDCFAVATSGCFDGQYSGFKDNLLNFRNYGAVCITSYSSSLKGKIAIVCSLAFDQTYYHNGSSANPNVGDTCYSDSGGTTVLASGYYARTGPLKYFIDSSGAVSSMTVC